MNNPRIVIVAYKPFPGKEEDLKALLKTHVSRLKAESLVTDREPILMQAQDGTIIEVFEWLSEEAIEKAHSNAAVQKMWAEFAEVCEYIPVGNVPEASQLFSEFSPI